jgi:prophage regulatory protein
MKTSPRRNVLRLRAVALKTGLKRDSIYRLAKQGTFPKPIKLGERASGWIESEVDDFIARRAAARDGAQVTQ